MLFLVKFSIQIYDDGNISNPDEDSFDEGMVCAARMDSTDCNEPLLMFLMYCIFTSAYCSILVTLK